MNLLGGEDRDQRSRRGYHITAGRVTHISHGSFRFLQVIGTWNWDPHPLTPSPSSPAPSVPMCGS